MPDSVCVKVNNLPKKIKFRGKDRIITIGRLKKIFGQNKKINGYIRCIFTSISKKKEFKINLPITLTNEYYTQLYSLMLSEGSYKTEFRIHVPEEEFHQAWLGWCSKHSLLWIFWYYYSHQVAGGQIEEDVLGVGKSSPNWIIWLEPF